MWMDGGPWAAGQKVGRAGSRKVVVFWTAGIGLVRGGQVNLC